jgi:membrane fusion protein (multidrug efflux system)
MSSPLKRILSMIAAVWAAGMIQGCRQGAGSQPPPEPPPTEVVIGLTGQAPVEDTLTAVGTVEANERVEIKPETAGVIEAIHFQEGQRVQRGDKLFDIEARKEAAQFAEAEAEEQLARLSLERARTLAGTKAISRQELDQLESQLAVRTATVQLERERIQDRVIRAPLSGTVGSRLISPGQYVNAGMTLVTLVDDSQVKVRFRIPERDLALVKTGQEARLQVGAYPGIMFSGKVDLIHPEIDPLTRMAEIRLVAPNPDFQLKPGMFARISLVVAQRPSALVIPESALVPSQETFQVYLVETNVARLTPVKLGVRMPGQVEIREGLQLGQPIVVTGTQKLVDGARVAAMKESSGTAPVKTNR